MKGKRAIALGLLLGAAVSCGKKEPEAPPAPAPVKEEGPKGPPPPRVEGNVAGLDASKDLTDDLKALLERTLKAMADDPARFGEIVASLAVPNPEAWATATFGERGKAIAERMKLEAPRFEEEVKWTIEMMYADGFRKVEALRIKGVEDPRASGAQKQLIAEMKTPVTLYTVNFHALEGPGGQSMWSWAYIDGAFRFLGHLK